MANYIPTVMSDEHTAVKFILTKSQVQTSADEVMNNDLMSYFTMNSLKQFPIL